MPPGALPRRRRRHRHVARILRRDSVGRGLGRPHGADPPRRGFYEPGPELVFFAFCDAIRAARALVDLELHARGMDEDDAVALVESATLMPEGWARAQVLRSKRVPLQSLTYLIGSMEIEALRATRGVAEGSLSLHRGLLEAGPVPPSRLRTAMGHLREEPLSQYSG